MAEDSKPTSEQKSTLKGIIKEAVTELIDEREEKRRTDGSRVDDDKNKNDAGKDDSKKSFFESLFG